MTRPIKPQAPFSLAGGNEGNHKPFSVLAWLGGTLVVALCMKVLPTVTREGKNGLFIMEGLSLCCCRDQCSEFVVVVVIPYWFFSFFIFFILIIRSSLVGGEGSAVWISHLVCFLLSPVADDMKFKHDRPR